MVAVAPRQTRHSKGGPRRLTGHQQAIAAQATECAQSTVHVASGCSGDLEDRGLSGVVAEAMHLMRFGDHALTRCELGLVACRMRDEATVKTLEGLRDTMRVRND